MSRAGEAARRGAGNAPAGPGAGDARRCGSRRGAARFRRRARAGQVLGLRGGARRAPPRRQPRPGGRQAAEEAGDHGRRGSSGRAPALRRFERSKAARSARGRDRRAADARRPLRSRAGAEDHPGLVGRAGAACLGRARRRTLRAGEQSRRPEVPEEARADRRRDRRTPDARCPRHPAGGEDVEAEPSEEGACEGGSCEGLEPGQARRRGRAALPRDSLPLGRRVAPHRLRLLGLRHVRLLARRHLPPAGRLGPVPGGEAGEARRAPAGRHRFLRRPRPRRIYIGRGRFVHSPNSGDVVKISSIHESWYHSRWVGARRIA